MPVRLHARPHQVHPYIYKHIIIKYKAIQKAKVYTLSRLEMDIVILRIVIHLGSKLKFGIYIDTKMMLCYLLGTATLVITYQKKCKKKYILEEIFRTTKLIHGVFIFYL